MAAKHFEPTFKNEIERACYRFIFEEECVKEYYDLLNDGHVFDEVFWELSDDKMGVIVHYDSPYEDHPKKIRFSFKKYPALADFLDIISEQK